MSTCVPILLTLTSAYAVVFDDLDADGIPDEVDACLEHEFNDTDADGYCDLGGVRGTSEWTRRNGSTTINGTRGTHTTDLNLDGLDDVLVPDLNNRRILVHLGTPTGLASPEIITGMSKLTSIASGDLDGDDDIDLAIGDGYSSYGVKWLRQRHNGSWELRTLLTLSGETYVAVGDLNGDLLPDIAYSDTAGDTVAWLQNLGGGAFGPPTVLDDTRDAPKHLAIVDINQDGWPEVSVSHGTGSREVTLHTNTAGTLGAAVVVASDGIDVSWVDADDDTWIDILVGGNDLSVVWNDAGTLAAQTTLSTAVDTVDATGAGDVDGDGQTDVFASDNGRGTVVWFRMLNRVAGPAHTLAETSGYIPALAAGDWDQDGDADVLYAPNGLGPVVVATNPLGGTHTDGDNWDDSADCVDGDGAIFPFDAVCGGLDSDCDGVCDTVDVCWRDDVTGDSDGDGVCDTQLIMNPLVAGLTTTGEVVNAGESASIYLLLGLTGYGAEKCHPAHGDACTTLDRPKIRGVYTADELGAADVSLALPGGASGRDLLVHGVWVTAGGADGGASNIIEETVP